MTEKLISQGAEAHIFKGKKWIIKERKSKGYRISEIDNKLIKQRTKKESKLLEKSLNLIKVPKVANTTENTIVMQEIKGKKLADCLDKEKNKTLIAKEIGKSLTNLHKAGIIHGDLTTSNMIKAKDGIYFIDFGLGYESNNVEDKAVDLHVLKEALTAKHPLCSESFFRDIIKNYSDSAVIERLGKVESRGRYKQQY